MRLFKTFATFCEVNFRLIDLELHFKTQLRRGQDCDIITKPKKFKTTLSKLGWLGQLNEVNLRCVSIEVVSLLVSINCFDARSDVVGSDVIKTWDNHMIYFAGVGVGCVGQAGMSKNCCLLFFGTSCSPSPPWPSDC